LNYDSFDHVGAISHHINTSLVSVVFLIALALAVSIGAQVVGSLLVFILLTLPSSSARYLGKTIPAMLYWSVGIALV
ncbi:metal ABC transporter permease, partial [Escherichia coli]|nr:metal ABC transporter permease [Escherichia coli]